MSSLTEQQRKALRAEFIKALVSVLNRLRQSSDAQFRNTLYGMALGLISQANNFGLISWEEREQLDDLAINASSYAAREARHA